MKTNRTENQQLLEARSSLNRDVVTLRSEIHFLKNKNKTLEEENQFLANRLGEIVESEDGSATPKASSSDQSALRTSSLEPTFQPGENDNMENAATDERMETSSVQSSSTSFRSAVAPPTWNQREPTRTLSTPEGPTVHVNALGGETSHGRVVSKRYPTPPFDASGKPSSFEWLTYFENLIDYHQWDEHQAMREFMMAMHGPAALWWRARSDQEKSSYQAIKNAFSDFFGGAQAEMSNAIASLETMKQGKEKMMSFGPKLALAISKVTGESPLQLHYFYKAVSKNIADLVAAKEPASLDDAIKYAIRLERNQTERAVVAPIPTTPFTSSGGWNQGDPMEGVETSLNSQYSKKFQRREPNTHGNQGSSNNGRKPTDSKIKGECFVCQKTGHKAVDCYLLKKYQNQQNRGTKPHNREGKRIHNNVQVIQNDHPQSRGVETEEFDVTANMFFEAYHANSQMVDDVDHFGEIPVVCGSAIRPDPHSFVMTATVTHVDTGDISSLPVLIDTGSMISTIRSDVADALGLQSRDAAPLRITYGNESTGVSDKAASLSCVIHDFQYDFSMFRVVPQQNVEVILGMDWLVHFKALIDPVNKTLLIQQKINNSQSVAKPIHTLNSPSITNLSADVEIPQEIADFLLLYPNLISQSPTQTITNAPIQHRIDTGSSPPIVRYGRRLSPKERAVIEDEVQVMLKAGVIRPSNSPWCSPPVMVPKPDGSLRFCTNFRALNAVTRKDKYPLVRMDDLLDRLGGASHFSVIDLKSAYWQIPIHEDDKCKTAFSTGSGLYEYNVLAFGLTNAPPTFCRFMTQILRSVSAYTLVYLDDILIYGRSREENLQQVLEVLRILHHWNMKISLSKCQFMKTELRFLGFLVSASGVKSDPTKIDPIKTWPTPTCMQELQRFLGFCTFYHKFLHNLSRHAAPLYRLLRKDTPWKWGSREESAFQQLKNMVINLPELAYPNPYIPYELHCDASDFGLGAVLVQIGRPIAFASQTLSPAEQNYTVTERECLAVSWSLKHFHCYVHGATLIIYTDHAALRQLLSKKDPSGRIARWVLDIWTYDFTVVHRREIDNADADALSRLMIPGDRKPVPRPTINSQVATTPLSLHNIRLEQARDSFVDAVSRQASPDLFAFRDGILYFLAPSGPVVVVPPVLRSAFLYAVHDDVTSGHLGREKTLDKALSSGWWPSIRKDTIDYVKGCERCQIHKMPTHKYRELKSIQVSLPGEIWAADIAYMPLSTRGNKYILVFMEYLTKWVITVPLPQFDTNAIVNVLIYAIILVNGTPQKFITDNGTNFISEAMKLVCQRLGINKVESSVEHPQTDGLVERMNRTVKESLAIYVEKTPELWDEYLPFVTFAINTTKQASTGYSPFEALYGRRAVLPALADIDKLQVKNHNSQTWLAYINHYMQIIRNDIRANLQKSQERQQKYFNRGRKEKEEFKLDDVVYKIKIKENWKFPKAKYTGPWRIIKIKDKEKMSFELELLNNKTKKRTTANIRDIYKKYSQ
ncbi:hypothetical protein G6F60_010905 [Rhizopus arrhizus]|nr:hypothetical protein G6F60_010905 [Rhizopus arrhizus]